MHAKPQIAILVCRKVAAILFCKSASLQHVLKGKSASLQHVLKGKSASLQHVLKGKSASLRHVLKGKSASLRQVNENELVTTRQTCQKLAASNSLQTIAKTEYVDSLGFEPPTANFLNLSS
ncbi:hypothetical protein AVEN_195595-1 [Araneus ventricosus]|uniref:Uncharacterized protein n=1 Tax=Araneus ventricosus TaxID=182803 RepID=A0A4Y2B957_ARAVE|nr:hypothetical protein AVEN_195595-1 [Araneus ventricosus]